MQNAGAISHYHLWPVALYHISPHYLKTAKFSGKMVKHETCVFILSTIFSEIFLILRAIQLDIINVHNSSSKLPAIIVRFS